MTKMYEFGGAGGCLAVFLGALSVQREDVSVGHTIRKYTPASPTQMIFLARKLESVTHSCEHIQEHDIAMLQC